MTGETIVLASGGTGGHIFPAEALAEELTSRGFTPVLITDKRYKQYSKKDVPFDVYTIRASTFSGNLLKKISCASDIAVGFWQARRLLKKLKPAAVVGFGGYPSFPTMLAATRMGLKTIIHEQNSMLGRVNQVLVPKVNAIATSFAEVEGIDEKDKHKIKLTGNPVRPAIAALRDVPYPDLTEDGVFRLLVTGGSQGASVFSTVVPQAIEQLPAVLKARVRVDQQCRPEDIEKARTAYSNIGVSADLATFFGDIPTRLVGAHLFIGRAGASTLAELMVAGRPAILVPFPRAKDNHQMVNANALEEAGGGWVMPQDGFTAAALAARIESLITLPSTLAEAAEKAKEVGRPDAGKQLADLVQEVMIPAKPKESAS